MSLSEYHKYETDDALVVMDVLKKSNTQGASITIPLKADLFPLLSSVSKSAETIGAVNTVTKLANGELVGENTDWLAMRDLIKINITTSKLSDYCGLVVGTGGVAMAACYLFNQLKIPYYIWGRDLNKAMALKQRHHARDIFYNDEASIDIIPGVAAKTPLLVVMCIPPEVELDLTKSNCQVVLEQGYTSKPKRKYPESCTFISGLDILVTQARYQNNIWMANHITGYYEN